MSLRPGPQVHSTDAKDFVATATSPAAWYSHAEWLVGSSELLWEQLSGHFDRPASFAGADKKKADVTHAPAFLLLVGFALEAMLKAAALQVELNAGGVDRVLVLTPTLRLRPWLKTHSLEAIAARAGVEYTEEEHLYLLRFEKHLKWAGRYPVPLAPELGERGFDYRVSAQDHTLGQALLQRAREAYEAARNSVAAWKEMDGIGDYRIREAEWMAAITAWLGVVRQHLIRHAILMARGDRGVLQLTVETEEMRRHFAGPLVKVRLNPVWVPVDEFLAAVSSRDGVGRESAKRWAKGLLAMDPHLDAALFLCSKPDADGRWFSRFILLKEAEDLDSSCSPLSS